MLHRGVYAIAGVGRSWHRDVIGLVLSTPKLSAASHKTAAYLWGMTSLRPDSIEVVTVRHLRTKRDNPTIHESVDLVPQDVVAVDAIPTTTARRTIVDLGATASPRYVERCLDAGLREGLFTVDDVRRMITRVARSGRNGIGTIRPLVEDRIEWNTVTESALEDLFRTLVARSGIPMPVGQFELVDPHGGFVCRADFAYPERRVLIELDSERFHMDRETFQLDRAKQNRAHALGWTVYRFTWRQLQDDPGAVLRVLASATCT
jgi:hypothetical protein